MPTKLFPNFTRNKYSLRVCNTNYKESPVKYVSVSKHLKERLRAEEGSVYFFISKTENSIVFTTNPRVGTPIDLSVSYNPDVCNTLLDLSFDQGVTYFGQDCKVGTYRGIEFKTNSLKSALKKKNVEKMKRMGILVL